jgi:hypothetical protein
MDSKGAGMPSRAMERIFSPTKISSPDMALHGLLHEVSLLGNLDFLSFPPLGSVLLSFLGAHYGRWQEEMSMAT